MSWHIENWSRQQESLDDLPQDESLRNFSCPNKKCHKFEVRGERNIRVFSTNKQSNIRLLYCRDCDIRFSERIGTFLDDCRLPPETVVGILELLIEGKSHREIGRLLKVDRGTVGNYAKKADGRAQEIRDDLTDILLEKKRNALLQESGLHPEKCINEREFRDCINHQILELLCSLDCVPKDTVLKSIVDNGKQTQYSVCSADGITYPITLFTVKLWDLILLELTGRVFCDGQFEWGEGKKWSIRLDTQTIAGSLGISGSVDISDHVIAVGNVLQNINITVGDLKIEGYLDSVEVSAAVGDAPNTVFNFCLNPALVQYLKSQGAGIYSFNLCWLHLPLDKRKGHSRNVYAAAKRVRRYCGQNICKSNILIKIGDLWDHLPYLKTTQDSNSRKSFHRALRSIPDARCYCSVGEEMSSLDYLEQSRLRSVMYRGTEIIIFRVGTRSSAAAPCQS